MAANRLNRLESMGLAAKPTCAEIRSWGFKWVDVEDLRAGIIALDNSHEATGAVVRTLKEVATAFGVAATTAKNDWRDNGLPGKQGRWDLAAILAWRIQLDARSKGQHVPVVDDVLYSAIERLAEQYTIPKVKVAFDRYWGEWEATLAECEAEELKQTKSTRRRR